LVDCGFEVANLRRNEVGRARRHGARDTKSTRACDDSDVRFRPCSRFSLKNAAHSEARLFRWIHRFECGVSAQRNHTGLFEDGLSILRIDYALRDHVGFEAIWALNKGDMHEAFVS